MCGLRARALSLRGKCVRRVSAVPIGFKPTLLVAQVSGARLHPAEVGFKWS